MCERARQAAADNVVRSEPAVCGRWLASVKNGGWCGRVLTVTIWGKTALTFWTRSFGRVVFSLRFSKISESSERRSVAMLVKKEHETWRATRLTLTLLPGVLVFGECVLVLQEVEHILIGFA